MATTKAIPHPEFGTITLRKVRTAKHIRLRLPPKGGVLVTMPSYVPFQTGLNYALKEADWISRHQNVRPSFKTGDRIGRSHSFSFQAANIPKVTTRLGSRFLLVRYPASLPVQSDEVQTAAYDLAVRALKLESIEILPMWLNKLAREHGFTYEDCLLRQLKSRWGSCSSHKIITLNIFLMMLPDELIEYVLLHELTHTEHMNHSAAFWQRLEQALPNAKQLRKTLKPHNPAL